MIIIYGNRISPQDPFWTIVLNNLNNFDNSVCLCSSPAIFRLQAQLIQVCSLSPSALHTRPPLIQVQTQLQISQKENCFKLSSLVSFLDAGTWLRILKAAIIGTFETLITILTIENLDKCVNRDKPDIVSKQRKSQKDSIHCKFVMWSNVQHMACFGTFTKWSFMTCILSPVLTCIGLKRTLVSVLNDPQNKKKLLPNNDYFPTIQLVHWVRTLTWAEVVANARWTQLMWRSCRALCSELKFLS